MDATDIVTSGVDTVQEQNEESQMKLTYLNDDCLIHIFSLLNNKDLVNLCAASDRFNDACRTVFSIKKDWREIYGYNNWDDLEMAKNLVDRFADLILSFEFNCQTKENSVNYGLRNSLHDLIIERCSDSLERISFVEIDDSLKFTKPFPKVKTLFFYGRCSHQSLSEIRTFFPNVERFSVNRHRVDKFGYVKGFAPQRIPSLKAFQFYYDAFHSEIQLNSFIALNPQLCNLSTSIDNWHKDKWWPNIFVEQNGHEKSANNGNVYDYPMSIRITDGYTTDCRGFFRLNIPHERVEILYLTLSSLTAAEFITKCSNIKKLRLHLWFDSDLFNASYFNQIASGLPLLEELVVALRIQREGIYGDSNESEHRKGSIRVILPFIRQCRKLVKIQFRHFIQYSCCGDNKTKSLKHLDQDFRGFENIIRMELTNWTSNYKNVENTQAVVGYTYDLAK